MSRVIRLLCIAIAASSLAFASVACEEKKDDGAEKENEGEGEAEGEGEGEAEGEPAEGESADGEAAENEGETDEGEGEAAEGETAEAEAEPEAADIDFAALEPKADDAGVWGYQDTEGNVVVSLEGLAEMGEVTKVEAFAGDRAFVRLKLEGDVKQGWTMIDGEGNALVDPPVLTRAGQACNEVFIAHSNMGTAAFDDDVWGVVGKQGGWVVEPSYSLIACGGEDADYVMVRNAENLWGWVGHDGTELIAAEYKKIDAPIDGAASLSGQDGKRGFYFVEAKKLLEPTYDDCYVDGGKPMCKMGDEKTFFDLEGNPVDG